MVHDMIRLYPPNETKFDSNGLGILAEATSCVITEEADGVFELELVYPIFGKHYKEITNRSIIFAKPNPFDDPQAFRIYEISRPMNGLVTFYAQHISYDLSGYVVSSFTANSCVEAFNKIPTSCVTPIPFTFWTDKTTSGLVQFTMPTPIRNLLGGVEGSILDIYKGDYKFDNFTVRLYGERGVDRGYTIRYGKNMTDISQQEKSEKLCSGVYPYWYYSEDDTLVTLPEYFVKPEGTFDYTNIMVVDFSQDFEKQPSVAELRAAAQQYIKDNEIGLPVVSIDVSFEMLTNSEEYADYMILEQVELFDTVHVKFEDLNIEATAKVQKTEFDAIKGKYQSITIGDIRPNISDTIVQQGSSTSSEMGNLRDNLAGLKTELQAAVDNATKWITSGGGYIVAVKNSAGIWTEICSLNINDINRATKVWRWNNNGFGFSSKGYNGPYTTAITQDGQIVADFITTGSLTAAIIKSGILILGGPNNDGAKISIKDNSNNEIGYINNTGVYFNRGTIVADLIQGGTLVLGGRNNTRGYLSIVDVNNVQVCSLSKDGLNVTKGSITGGAISGGTITGSDIIVTGRLSTDGVSYTAGTVYLQKDGERTGVLSAEGLRVPDITVTTIYSYIQTSAVEKRVHLKLSTDGFEIRNTDTKLEDGSSLEFTDYQGVYRGAIKAISDEMIPYGNQDPDGDIIMYGPISGMHIYSEVGSLYLDEVVVLYSLKQEYLSRTYSIRTMNAVTSATPISEDYGEGFTDEDGKCYVYFDDVFAESTNTAVEYQVFLQKEGPGDIWVSEKTKQYFLVEGTKNLKFSWTVKVHSSKTGFERLENGVTPTIDIINYESTYNSERNELISDSIRLRDTQYIDELTNVIKEKEEAIYEAAQ